VRMVERGQRGRFALKARQAIRIATDLRQEDLERDVAAQLWITSSIHLAHAPGTERSNDLVDAEAGAGGKGH
jgi:hypothetical protein